MKKTNNNIHKETKKQRNERINGRHKETKRE